ncbi:hypothetical protein A3C98_03060 [Candidatus Roizmanbacteria bacterium RIFCSPHIGHO2_02_FULL_37_15]|uniref:Glycosyltransferase RgtA/B/C/D-like domain-containing protein n=1 Tax=Candidatus Roizmanbacteria bacterium RIFCSPLOWO2_01_FULL_37_16 TaxID=1802058 RepID=A0A1F7IJ18_9BACT|nr:MAG: hypothetical protein A2859_01120 [Candidatus Roizmanbacteria bacterium RIFCSPHIGHO2_01_FULL_37_16b]OGK21076.1 MAG: hypothetical protein A3C98_03060 [Candidatus Roizmanbacteria bacterium RIFCSPHIGHO2_02_FULL_37_15]OGK31417.1 MAG: hypothetical protein A3F57_01325 [Candidatus Roizmanbacteria bacterium RIFCSPHIGHO2_12_FULL_36_11]OGK43358.1 MAG: hypothetical protein A3B40_00995 [Candidatus Roizmanbacteria bacterium RIFCSPLOWO2_01_FULL_37_16]
MVNFIKKYKYHILLWIFIVAYIIYFSYFTILRYRTLYASYYDLGIMQQTVYNTFMSIKTGDWSRLLELTNPIAENQIKRVAIHNDILLALLAPFYFFNSSPGTLLVVQSMVTALGAFAIFKITNLVLAKVRYSNFLALVFSLAYLLYPPLERANIFDFHAVTFATTFLLFMFYFWLIKKYKISLVFFALSLLSKEQVALTTLFFGIYIFTTTLHSNVVKRERKHTTLYASKIISVSIIWFIFSVFYLIPLFRSGQHFAVSRYSDFGDSPIRIIIGIVSNPDSISKLIFREDTWRYFVNLLAPIGFLSLFSPIQLIIALPEFAINLLSNNPNMRNINYQYTAVITPFVFVSAIYGVKKLIDSKIQPSNWQTKGIKTNQLIKIVIIVLLISSLSSAYLKGPLPFAKTKDIHPIKYPQKEAADTAFWAKTLKDENLKISTTGQLSPFFTSRRYFYIFSSRYSFSDYVIVRLNEIYDYPEKNELIPVYERLKKDKNYELIFKKENFEVYKKVASS